MNDRELLELAAKVAGIVGEYSDTHRCFASYMEPGWNPLMDDGDALRLANTIGMTVDTHYDMTPRSSAEYFIPQVGGGIIIEAHGPNVCAATRRAIVRAAAEIGKKMNEH